MAWEVKYLESVAKKDIPALPKSARELIQKAIEGRIKTEPQKYGKPLRFNLSGLRRVRVASYRIVYKIEAETKTVIITDIRHRKDVYDD